MTLVINSFIGLAIFVLCEGRALVLSSKGYLDPTLSEQIGIFIRLVCLIGTQLKFAVRKDSQRVGPGRLDSALSFPF